MATNDILSTATPHPEFAAAVEKMGGTIPALGGDVHALRKWLEESKAKFSSSIAGDWSNVIAADSTITARDGYEIPYRIYKPSNPPSSGSPLVIMFHGGGFCLGGLTNEDLNCRQFAQKFGCVCLNIDYRLAPENPFPAGVNDCWDATKFAATKAASLGADPSQGFIVGGTSAGGNLADVVVHLARDEKLSPPVTGVLEMIPVLIPFEKPPAKYKDQYLSWEQNKDAPVLARSSMHWMMDLYKADTTSQLAFPFQHADGHAGMPPVFFQACGMDPLRDDSVIYERVLREEHGVQTQLKMYPGVPHGFWSVLPDLQLSKQFASDTLDGVGWLLSLVKKQA